MANNPSLATKISSFQIIFLVRICLSFYASTAQGLHSECQNLDPSPRLTIFLDPLRIPSAIDVSNGSQLTLGAYKITQKLHSELPATTLYAYGTSQASATYPGPTLLATRNMQSNIRFENHILDSNPILTVDRTIHWANPPRGGVPIVTHLHGAEVQSYSDGHPDAWFTAAGDKGPTFLTQNYSYPNRQNAAMLWYHDHTDGITRISVLSGLAGLYFIRSPTEEPPNLPTGMYEIPLVISDVQLWANGSINFPDIGDSPDVHPNWCPEYFGDTILVNGVAWPHLEVYPTKYRFRILNAANARFFVLSLNHPSVTVKFVQLGTDGGFLPTPLILSTLTVAPAYRLDVIVDFSNVPPKTSVYLNNSGAAPFPSGDPAFSPPSTNSVLEFRVVSPPSFLPLTTIPLVMAPVPFPLYDLTTPRRRLTLIELDDASGNPVVSRMNNLSWVDPVTETPRLGATEIWEIVNFTPDAHPMHLHLINFLTLRQQSFNQTAYDAGLCTLDLEFPNSRSCFTEHPRQPDVTQTGWKDTVIVYPSVVTTLWTRWTTREGLPFSFDATTAPGYVWHCHILDHEDNDMMRPVHVLP